MSRPPRNIRDGLLSHYPVASDSQRYNIVPAKAGTMPSTGL